jgi:hypothetical protein
MTTDITPRCSYDVILPGIDNEAPCGLDAGHDGPHRSRPLARKAAEDAS